MPAVVYTYLTRDEKKSSVRFNINSLANVAALTAAVEAVTDGVLNKTTEISAETDGSDVPPVTGSAIRGAGLRLYVSDNVNNENGSMTIPAPAFTALTYDGEQVELADAGVMAALVTQIETNVLSRDGNAVTVVAAKTVGRNT